MAKFFMNESSKLWDGALPSAVQNATFGTTTGGVNWNGRESVAARDLERSECVFQNGTCRVHHTPVSVIVWQRGWEMGTKRNELGSFVECKNVVDRRIEYGRDGKKNVTYFHHAWK